jgi:hypothetical protein
VPAVQRNRYVAALASLHGSDLLRGR